MQTDVHLQRKLVEVVKDELKNYTSVNNEGVYLHFNVYPQNLPAKTARPIPAPEKDGPQKRAPKGDDSHFPYVLVCLDEEEIGGENDDCAVTVHFLVGIIDRNTNNQGHFDVAEVMNRLTMRFLKERLIADRYRINFPVTKVFQREDTWPKFLGGISTVWTVEAPELEETEFD